MPLILGTDGDDVIRPAPRRQASPGQATRPTRCTVAAATMRWTARPAAPG